jgi:peptidoglycan/xylan/chitin deacetylase (PgdA/CDA1 family)
MFARIANKRQFLARALAQTGLLAFLEKTIVQARPGLIVLTYHRIADPTTDRFYSPVISATPDQFRDQVAWIADRLRTIGIDELIDHLGARNRWREPVVLVTFDDGYQDNFAVAAPVLRSHTVPATFFLPTAFLDAPCVPWWDQVAYVIKHTQVVQLSLARDAQGVAPKLEIDLRQSSRDQAIMTIIGAFLAESIPDAHWFLEQLATQADVEVDAPQLGRELFMSWEQLRQLAEPSTGISIGSHAHSHRKLAALDPDDQFEELARSKQTLEGHLGRPVRTLAYPFGWQGTFTPDTQAMAERAGYQAAFSSIPGINRPAGLDRFAIRRLGIGSSDSAVLIRARTALFAAFGNSLV